MVKDSFAGFVQALGPSAPPASSVGTWPARELLACDGYSDLRGRFAGHTYQRGLYRLHDAATAPAALGWLHDALPSYRGRAFPFAFDWRGRQFAVDTARTDAEGESQVLLFEPGSGDVYEIPATFAAFHQVELVEFPDPSLSTDLYREWRDASGYGEPLGRDECVGYTVPLSLGGRNVVDNLELTDLDVYWSFSGQILEQTAALPSGSRVKRVFGRRRGK